MGKVMSVCISEVRGTKKKQIDKAMLVKDWGIEGDAHAGSWHRAVSLRSYEKYEAAQKRFVEAGFKALQPGDFAENIMVSGIDFAKLPVGIRFRCGSTVLRMTQIGKECHADCEIRRLTGDCIMPREGVFAVVEQGGEIRPGDEFGILPTVAVITVSDSGAKGEREDKAGPVIVEAMERMGYYVGETHLVSDDRQPLADLMAQIADENRAQLILTTGGTGFSPRDTTPEATTDIAERMVPGIPEAMRAYSMRITPRGMLSRGTAALRKSTLIINLPGSPKAVRENLEAVTPALTHGIEILVGAASNCAVSGEEKEKTK
ncbi:MAG: MOSC domain-containing protein [Firmicutes bacterium]|nr:MOSC domain-containing protein [Bacillota bacterium]